jgi:Ca2+-binding EF-hand superfamily protein
MLNKLGKSVTDKELAELITFSDADGSGQIEFEEFLKLIEKLKVMQADKDD